MELTWEEWEDRVRSGRVPPDTLVEFEPVTGDQAVPASTLEMYRSLRGDAHVAYERRFEAGPAPILTALLVGVQVRIWWLGLMPGVAATSQDLFALSPAPILEDGEIWRFLSSGLVHGGPCTC